MASFRVFAWVLACGVVPGWHADPARAQVGNLRRSDAGAVLRVDARGPSVRERSDDAGVGDASAALDDASRDALSRLTSDEPSVRAQAVDQLGTVGTRARQRASDALRPRLRSDPDPLVRAAAGRALGRLMARDAIPELVLALDDAQAEVRVVAAAALWRMPDPIAVLPLLARTSDGDAAVREWSALALGVAADERALPALVRLLDDPARAVRLSALRSLGRIGNGVALDPLVRFASAKRDDEEQAEAITAIAALSSDEREHALLRLLPRSAAEQRVRIVLALGRIGDVRASSALEKLATRDPAEPVRAAARRALLELGERLELDAGRPAR